MRLRTIPIALVAAVVLSLSQAASVSGQATKLSKDDKKVLDYLVKYWGEDYDVTSVDLALESLKMEPSDSTRFRIGAYIKQHPELHEVIRRWGWVTIVLNADEKLIARSLI